MKDDDFGRTASLMNPMMNFPGLGAPPWLQPSFNPSMFNLKPDMYQAMAAAALQEFRAVDSLKQQQQSLSPSLLQFQQSQNLSNGGPGSNLLASQLLQQMHPQSHQALLQAVQQNQFMQNQLQQVKSQEVTPPQFGTSQQPITDEASNLTQVCPFSFQSNIYFFGVACLKLCLGSSKHAHFTHFSIKPIEHIILCSSVSAGSIACTGHNN